MSVSSKALSLRSEPGAKKVNHMLPLILRLRGQIDEVFARYVGPISRELSQEEFDKWRADGPASPLGLHRYIARLASYISSAKEREAFIAEATGSMQITGRPK